MSTVYDKAIADIERYDSKADVPLVKALSKTYALVMSNKDASGVACSDASELKTVRENFLKKKLGLTQSDTKLDEAIADVCKQMSADRKKSRITVYYLLAKKFGKESIFI